MRALVTIRSAVRACAASGPARTTMLMPQRTFTSDRPFSWGSEINSPALLPATGVALRGPAARTLLWLAAVSLDNAMSWARPDFLLVNGTNVFMYPEGRSPTFPATVVVHTESDWQVATGMAPAGTRTYGATNYHDLVDMPFFIGNFDLDSV